MIVIKGKTYDLKDDIKAAGYKYDAGIKAWVGSSRDGIDKMIAKMTKPGYGVRYSQLAKSLIVEEVVEL